LLQTAGKVLAGTELRTLDQASRDAAMLDKTKQALRVLAEDHLRAASVPVSECLRQFDRDPKSFRVAAFYYLLTADWPSFDQAMGRFEHYEGDAGIQYLRALESLKRYGVRKDARERLDDALRIDPRMVRAQAKLVLIEDGIEEMNAELQKLHAMNPTHLVVSVAGPAIKREYDFSSSLARARAAQSTPSK
jgi:Tfp pilus assembly protein PilF